MPSHVTALSINALRPFVKDVSEHYKLDLYVKGVRCGHCIHKIEKSLNQEKTVSDYQMSSDGQNLSLFVQQVESFPHLIQLIDSLGFEAIPVEDQEQRRQEELATKRSLKQLAVAGVCAGNIMLFSTAIYLGAPKPFENFFNMLSFVLAIPVIFYSAEPIWKGFYTFFKSRRFNLDLPIGLAVGFGFVLSTYSFLAGLESIYFDSLSVVIFIILCSRFLLNSYIKSIYQKNLNQCIPGVYQARLVVDGKESLVSPQEIKAGDTVKVIRSEVCPVDGELFSDQAIMDLSVLTGEAEPQIIKKGEKVFAGSLLCASDCLVRVSQIAEKTRVGQLVEASLKSIEHGKEESYRYVSFFTTLVIAISGLSFLGFFFWQGASVAFQRSFAIIIVACPCAVSFGLPLIRMLSGQLGLKNGILVKKPQILTRLLELKHIYFDKTGTLTDSKVEISPKDFLQFSLADQNLILSLELAMDHPISNGFKKLQTKEHSLKEVKDFKYLPAQGLQAVVEGSLVEILSQEKGKPASAEEQKNLFIYKEGMFVGKIKISSSIKKSAQELVDYLSLKNKKISLLSGDQHSQVEKLWKIIPDSARGDLLSQATPEEKEKYVSLNAEDSLMVGDGINDIAALQKAHVGITLPGALENNLNVADIALLKSDLTLIKKLYFIAAKVRRTERGLLTFTTLYNSLCIILALMGYITPVAAAILMPISSITVLFIVMTNLRRI